MQPLNPRTHHDPKDYYGFIPIKGKWWKVDPNDPNSLIPATPEEAPPPLRNQKTGGHRKGFVQEAQYNQHHAKWNANAKAKTEKPKNNKDNRNAVLTFLYAANGITERMKMTDAMKQIASHSQIDLSTLPTKEHTVTAIRMIGSFVVSALPAAIPHITPQTLQHKFKLHSTVTITDDEWNSLYDHAEKTFAKYNRKASGITEPPGQRQRRGGSAQASGDSQQKRARSESRRRAQSADGQRSRGQSSEPQRRTGKVISDKEYAALLAKGRSKWTAAEKAAAAIKAHNTHSVLNPSKDGKKGVKNNYNPGEIPLLSMRYPGEGMRL